MATILKIIGRRNARQLVNVAQVRAQSSDADDHSYQKYGKLSKSLCRNVVTQIEVIIIAIFDSPDKDPAPKFFQRENRSLMQNLTRLDIDRVYRSRQMENNYMSYKFLTAEEVKQKLKTSLRLARRMLAMPPVVQCEKEEIEILSRDPELQGFTDSQLIAIDISPSVPEIERSIVIRQPNGNLETAPPDVRRRMIATYFPRDDRHVIVPKMFETEHLTRCLDNGNYEFVLDRACEQFEPFNCDYHRVTALTYEHINKHKAFDVLRSTRHFGPMVFYLAWHKNIDNLLIDCIKRDYLRNAAEAIILSYNLHDIEYDQLILRELSRHPERNDEYYYRRLIEDADAKPGFEIEKEVGKTNEELEIDDICAQFIDEYLNKSPGRKNDLKAALNTQRELIDEKRKYLAGLEKAHGVRN